jgi:hypothetical protein
MYRLLSLICRKHELDEGKSRQEMTSPTCPNCGAPVIVGAIFCDSCGLDLRMVFPMTAPSTIAPAVFTPGESFSASALPVYEPPISSGQTLPSARLVIVSSNISLELPADRLELVVGREDAVSGVFPEINLEPFGAQDAGVSRRHIKLHNSGGNWVVEDLNTVNGTFLNRQRLAASQVAPLKHGDELRLGNMAFIFYQGE